MALETFVSVLIDRRRLEKTIAVHGTITIEGLSGLTREDAKVTTELSYRRCPAYHRHGQEKKRHY
jgi:hypothetical protein